MFTAGLKAFDAAHDESCEASASRDREGAVANLVFDSIKGERTAHIAARFFF